MTVYTLNKSNYRKSDSYKNIYYYKLNRGPVLVGEGWRAEKVISGMRYTSPFCETEKGAALMLDKKLLSLGLQPINVLKLKQAA